MSWSWKALDFVSTVLNISEAWDFCRSKQQAQRKTPEAKSEEYQSLISDAARPFLAARTDRFVIELELFLASGLNIEAYDAVYRQRLGWNAPGVTSESTEGQLNEHRTAVIPYMYIFDEDSDETDWNLICVFSIPSDFLNVIFFAARFLTMLQCLWLLSLVSVSVWFRLAFIRQLIVLLVNCKINYFLIKMWWFKTSFWDKNC